MAVSSGLQNLKKVYEEKLKKSHKGKLTSKTLKKVFLLFYNNGSYDDAQKEWEALTHNTHPEVTWLKKKIAKKLAGVCNLVSILPASVNNVGEEDCTLTKSPKDDLSAIDLISTLPGCAIEDGVKKYNLRNSSMGQAMHRKRDSVTGMLQTSMYHDISFSSSSEDSDIDVANLDAGDSHGVVEPSQKIVDGENDFSILSKERIMEVCTLTKSSEDELKNDSSGTDQKGEEDSVKKKDDVRLKNTKNGEAKHRRRALATRKQQVYRSHNSSLSSSEDVEPSQKSSDAGNGYAFLPMSKERNKAHTPTKPSKEEFKQDTSGMNQEGKEDGVKIHTKGALAKRSQLVHEFRNSISSSEDSHDIINVRNGESPDEIVDSSPKTINGENSQALLSLSKERNKKVCTPTKPSKDEFNHDSSGIDEKGKQDRVKKKHDLVFKNNGKVMQKRKALATKKQRVCRSLNSSLSSSEDTNPVNVDVGNERWVGPSQKTSDGENAFLHSTLKERKKARSPTKPSEDDSCGIEQGGKEDRVRGKYDPRLRRSKEGKEPVRRKPRESITTAQQIRALRNSIISSSEDSDIAIDAIDIHNGDSGDVANSSQETTGYGSLSLSRERAKKVRGSTPKKLPTVSDASIAYSSAAKEIRENERAERGKQHGKPRFSAGSTTKQTSLCGDIGETSETTDSEAQARHLEKRCFISERHETQSSTSGHGQEVAHQVRKAKTLSKHLSTATQNLRRIVNDPYQNSTTEDEEFDGRAGETTTHPYNVASRSKKWKPELDIRKRRWNAPHKNAAVVQWGFDDIDEDLERLKERSKRGKLKAPKRRKRKYWSAQEAEWLKEGVGRYGKGKWAEILIWYPFKERSSVDLKDKFRNMERNGEL